METATRDHIPPTPPYDGNGEPRDFFEDDRMKAFLREEDLPQVDGMIDSVTASWIVRRLKRQDDAIAEINKQAEFEIAKIRGAAAAIIKTHECKKQWIMDRYQFPLRTFAEAMLEGAKEKSVKLLSGVVGFRRKPYSFTGTITDQSKAVTFMRALGHSEAVKEVVNWSAIKDLIEVKDGRVVCAETGEVLDFLSVTETPEDTVFYIK